MGVSSALCVCRQRIVVQAYACGALHTKVDDFASGARFMCVFSAISFNCGSTIVFYCVTTVITYAVYNLFRPVNVPGISLTGTNSQPCTFKPKIHQF